MSKTAIQTGIIAITLLTLTIGGFGLMAYQTLAKETQLHEQVTILGKHRSQQNTFFSLRRTAEETSEDRGALQDLFFLRGSDSVDFLNLVEQLAPQMGVSAETETLSELTNEKTKEEWLQMSFSVTGGEQEVERFIEVLERLPYALRLTDLELIERSSSISVARITLQVRLLQYDS